jgi:hypothetical protein
MIKKILFLFLLSTGYVLGAETLYTWGYGDILGETLVMIKNVLQVNTFNDLWKMTLLISSIIATVSMIYPNSDPFRLPKVMVVSMGVWSIFVTSTIDIYIEDKVEPNYNKAITNVPWAVGYPFALFSQFEKVSGELYELMSSTPSSLNYSNTGFFTPVSIFSASSHQKIIDPRLFNNLDSYVRECAMPDFENGYKDFNSLTQSDDIWTYLGNTSPSTIAQYQKDDGSIELKNCDEYYTQVSSDLNTYVQGTGLTTLGQQIGLTSLGTISTMLQSSHNYLLGASKSATDILKQNVAMNMFDSSFKGYSMNNGVDSASTAYYASKGESAVQANMVISGILGSRYVPITKGILTTLVAGLTPMVALLMLTPMGMKVFMGYMTMLTWLALWHLGDIILNHIITVKTQSALSSYGEMTFQTKGIIDSTTLDYINMASSMYWMIPTIAMMVVGGFGIMTLSTIGGGMTSRVARGEAVATEMASGNIGHGNVSTNNMSANKWDSTKQMNVGNSFQSTSSSGTLNNGNYKSSGNNDGGNQYSFNNKLGFNQDSATGASFNHSTGSVVGTGNSRTVKSAITQTDDQGGQRIISNGTVNQNLDPITSSNVQSRTKDTNGQFQTTIADYTDGKVTNSTTTNNQGTTDEKSFDTKGNLTTENIKTKTGIDESFGTDGKVKTISIGSTTYQTTDTSGSSFKEAVSSNVSKQLAGTLTDAQKTDLSQQFSEAQKATNTNSGVIKVGTPALLGFGLQGSKTITQGNDNSITATYGDGSSKTFQLTGAAATSFGKAFEQAKTEETRNAVTQNTYVDMAQQIENDKSGKYGNNRVEKAQWIGNHQDEIAQMAKNKINTNVTDNVVGNNNTTDNLITKETKSLADNFDNTKQATKSKIENTEVTPMKSVTPQEEGSFSKGVNASAKSLYGDQALYKQAQQDGLIKDQWGSDGIADKSKMANYSSEQLHELQRFDGLGTNGLSHEASATIQTEIDKRESNGISPTYIPNNHLSNTQGSYNQLEEHVNQMPTNAKDIGISPIAKDAFKFVKTSGGNGINQERGTEK